MLISFRFPIGVAKIYKPFFKFFSTLLFVFIIYSCTPVTVSKEDVSNKAIYEKKEKITNIADNKQNIVVTDTSSTIVTDTNSSELKKIIKEIEIILPGNHNKIITNNFINSLELSIYKKNISELSFNINIYLDEIDLHKIIREKIKPGKIFIGPLTSGDTINIKNWCNSGAIFFSFASDRKLANDCVYLINFFPEDELRALFNYFENNSRIALLYPENEYGYYISDIIDEIAAKSNSLIINKASYKEDLSNAREAIKELSKYELRKHELERQKKILKSKNDEASKKALAKIEKLETIGELDFTHVMIPDYNIRLLQIVPLLPFYDVDPNKIQFVGTGVWDDEAFFIEPSLQKAIFPGITKEKRKNYIDEYIKYYNEEPIRTITLIHDLIGLLVYIIEKNDSLDAVFHFLNNPKISFEGIDGKFSFNDNLITRDLNILQISDRSTKLAQ